MSVRRTNAERSGSTRARLVGAARELFAEHGFADTSISRVADRAGVSTGAVYHHWRGKQELMAAVVSALHHDIAVEVVRGDPGEGSSALARFERASAVFLRRCADPDVGRTLLVEAPAVLGAQAWAELDRRWWQGPTEALLREAMDRREIGAGDPRLLAAALLGALTALGRGVAGDPAAGHPAAAAALRALTDGLRGGGAAGRPAAPGTGSDDPA